MTSDAEAYVRSLEPIGWRLGLERIKRLTALLGFPQNRFASIHVVGTNGKTSVARMTAALLEAHGRRSAAYVSPHVGSWRERILIGGEPIGEDEFSEAIERCRQAAEAADRASGPDDVVTQFELFTAAAFWAFAAEGVEVALIEAGLGGRLDATNVIPSRVTVLTSVGLDHTEWLGDTLPQIASEKLAVLRDHSTLISGELAPEAERVAGEAAERRHARWLQVVGEPAAELAELVPAGYQRRNLALAAAAASELLGGLELEAVRSARLAVPARAERVEGDPPLIIDVAHNADGARALAEALPEWADGRPVIACVAILEGKDARGILSALAPRCEAFVCTEIAPEAISGSGRPGGRSIPAGELARLAREQGSEALGEADPERAWEQARELARERRGVALASGSHYLLRSVWTERPAASS